MQASFPDRVDLLYSRVSSFKRHTAYYQDYALDMVFQKTQYCSVALAVLPLIGQISRRTAIDTARPSSPFNAFTTQGIDRSQIQDAGSSSVGDQ